MNVYNADKIEQIFPLGDKFFIPNEDIKLFELIFGEGSSLKFSFSDEDRLASKIFLSDYYDLYYKKSNDKFNFAMKLYDRYNIRKGIELQLEILSSKKYAEVKQFTIIFN